MNKLTKSDWLVICIAAVAALSSLTAINLWFTSVGSAHLDEVFFNHRDVIDITPKPQSSETDGSLNLDEVIWLDQSLQWPKGEVEFKYTEPEKKRHVPLDSFDFEIVEEEKKPSQLKKGGYREGDKGLAIRVDPPPSEDRPPLNSEWVEWQEILWADPVPPVETHV